MGDRIYPETANAPLNGASYNPKRIPPPATYRSPRRRGRNPICVCLSCMLSMLLVIALIIAIAGVIVYFTLHPKVPKYHILNAQISELSLTASSSNPALNYAIAFTLQAYNPNKRIGIYYDDIQVFMFYDQVQVGEDTIAAFYQGHRNTTTLMASLGGHNISLQDINVSDLQAAIGSESIPFQVLVKVKARVKIGRWKSPHFKVRDDCNVKVSPPSAAGGARLLSSSCEAQWKR